ncbi:hypothetical protein IQ247_15170 [Plectonema cf. radiosum LEGE 06105]|uniref:Uncharacterized protein n=1 Tax=Plectonema cf. radiosum LEGE 06105 TaxID=945769 RepID=A0A8J7K0S1_9CYAN|nr:hypothetical protein [Plectonema radiosum]MBE9213991.1 hypothetical protein [Plectonema cf. radiosum LEGE 06105]
MAFKLNKSDKDKLIELLRLRNIAYDDRHAFCQDIGIEQPGKLRFINVREDDLFASALINYLNEIAKIDSIYELCSKLKSTFSGTEHMQVLEVIRGKVAISNEQNFSAASKFLFTMVKKIWEDSSVNEFIELSSKEVIVPGNEAQNDIQRRDIKSYQSVYTINIIINQIIKEQKNVILLGEQGINKKKFLRKLNEELISKYKPNETRIPVHLDISSFNSDKGTFVEWMKYYLPKRYNLNKYTFDTLDSDGYKKVIFLFSGFEKVNEKEQGYFVKELKKITGDGKYDIKFVITSREKEKLLDPELVSFTDTFALELKPLDQEQIITYWQEHFQKNDQSLNELQRYIQGELSLTEYLKLPPDLIFFTEEYKDAPDKDQFIRQYLSNPERQKTLVVSKIKTTFKDENWNKDKYPQKKAEKWLHWLLKQLTREKTSAFYIFYIEDIQPKWLFAANPQVDDFKWFETELFKKNIYFVGLGLIVGLICGFSTGLLSDILNYAPRANVNLINYIFFGSISGMISGMIAGVLASKIEYVSTINSKSTFIVATIGLISGLIRWLSSKLIEIDQVQPLDLIIFGIIIAIVFYRLDPKHIKAVESVEWSWTKAGEKLRVGMICGALSAISMIIIAIISKVIGLNPENFQSYWLNNFLEKVFYSDNQQSLGTDITIFSSILGLLLYSVLQLLILRDYISRINNRVQNLSSFFLINRKYLGLIITVLSSFLFAITINMFIKEPLNNTKELLPLLINHFGILNTTIWGLLTLEIFVGVQIAIALGVQTDNNKYQKIEPNHDIKKAARNAINISVYTALTSFIINIFVWYIYYHISDFIWWIYYRPEDVYGGVWFGIIVGLMVGILSGLLNGENSGLVCIKHFVLRLILVLYGCIPCDYVGFLDYCAKKGLLEYIGGSYEFSNKDAMMNSLEK